jgi:hypothetical protein
MRHRFCVLLHRARRVRLNLFARFQLLVAAAWEKHCAWHRFCSIGLIELRLFSCVVASAHAMRSKRTAIVIVQEDAIRGS